MIKKFFLFLILIISCKDNKKGEYKIWNVKIYENTPAWDLALSVKYQYWWKIKKIVKKNPELLNYQEPRYGATLLLWAVGMEKYISVKTLLECGADPNVTSKRSRATPLFIAAGYSFIDVFAKKDPKYVKLLLKYGADPNICYFGFDEYDIIESGRTPLMNSIPCGIEKTKAIVEAGADIDAKTKSGETAAIVALRSKEFPEYAYYLIVEKKAKIIDPYYRRKSYGNENPNDKFYPVNLLRNWIFDLNSKEYKIKMEIVKEFARQGVNYWDTKIDKFTLEYIKKLYPNNWEEYIKKY